MNYTIRIGDKIFEVEIEDINKRPIVTRVNGQEILVQPETAQNEVIPPAAAQAVTPTAIATHPALHDGVITAPLPGTVVELFVKPGDSIEAGQVIMVIEAMKMKNSIRSTKSGVVSAVFISPGETVAHKQKLLEFLE